MRVLVTGGAGYLGSTLVPALLGTNNCDVTVVDTFEHGVASLASCCWDSRLTIVRGGHNKLVPLLPKHDVVIILAAIVGQSACDARPHEAAMVNQMYVKDICQRVSNEQAIVFPCTNSGYGVGTSGMCTEESSLNPISLYGRTKVEAEGYVMSRQNNSVSLRLATLFGWSPRMRRDLLVNDLTWRAVNDCCAVIYEGTARRNFCHVRDAARAFVHVLENWGTMRGQIYNVGDTRANMTKLTLCDKIKEHVSHFTYPLGVTGIDPDKRDYLVSNEKIESTGWKPMFTLDEGIQELVRGYAMLKKEQYGNV